MSGLPEIQGRAVTRPVSNVGQAGQAEMASARAYSDMAEAARSIGQIVTQWSTDRAAKNAQKDFNEAVNEAGPAQLPQIEGRSGIFGFLTAEDAAYNNMTETLYMQRVQSDVEAKVSELRNDPNIYGSVEGFDNAWAGYEEGLIEEAHEGFAVDVEAMVHEAQQKGRTAVAQDARQNTINEAKSAMDARISTLTDELDALARNGVGIGDPEFDRLARQLNDNLEIKTNNHLYGYSEDEAVLDREALALQLKTAAHYPIISEIYANEGYAEALKAADSMAEALNDSSANTGRMRTLLRQEVNLLQQNESAARAEQTAKEKAAKDERERVGSELDKRATRVLNDPNASIAQKRAAVEKAAPFITASRFGTLMGKVTEPPADIKMPQGQYAYVWQSALEGNIGEEDIFDMQMSESQRSRLLSTIESASDANLKSGIDAIKASHKISDFDFDISARDRQMAAVSQQQAIDELTAWAETLERPPTQSEVQLKANEIISQSGRASSLKGASRYLPDTGSGTYNPKDVQAAIDELASDLEAGRISKSAAAEQMQIITELERAQ